MRTDIAIVIPCYNSGAYLPEAINSVNLYNGTRTYEIVVVNDGSTDILTLDLLKELSAKGITVVHQDNKGPAAARNTGVKAASAPYILFLDSDNKISPKLIDHGVSVLERDAEVGVVYGNVKFFGDAKRPVFRSRELDIKSLLSENYIDMCSVVRKSAWQQVGGLDENRLLIGHEDWEFWIAIFQKGWKFKYVDEILFEYRIRENSLLAQTNDLIDKKRNYIFIKHIQLVADVYRDLSYQLSLNERQQRKPLRFFVKLLLKKIREAKR